MEELHIDKMNEKKVYFYIKLFVETNSEDQCVNLLNTINSLFEDCSYLSEKSRNYEIYWKINEYFELELVYESTNLIDKEQFEALSTKLCSGWEYLYSAQEMEGIWNPSDINSTVVPNLKWAQIGVYTE